MSALEVESLLRKMAALREQPTGNGPRGAEFEFHELYTVLDKVHAKVVHAEPLIDSRSSAAYALFTSDLRRTTDFLDNALDEFSSKTSYLSRTSRRLYHLIRRLQQELLGDGASSRQRLQQGRRTARQTSSSPGLWSKRAPTQGLQIIDPAPGQQLLVDWNFLEMGRPKIAKQFEEAHRDLQILLRLFSTYVADLIPKNQDTRDSIARNYSLPPSHIVREQDRRNILTILADGEKDIVAVVGMAGVGKTVLIREICDRAKEEAGFYDHLWVDVSQNFDPEKIFRDLMTSLNEKLLQLQHGEDLESYWWSMKEGLVDKKYIVVLDDVWNEDKLKWNQLLRLLCFKKTPGNKIIISTRIPAAAAAIQNATTYNLLPLSIKDSILVDTSGSYSIRRKVVQICSGLPKLVCMINSFATESICQLEAMQAVEEFDKQCTDNNGLLYIAEASYNNLPSHLQRCFLYCSLFPLDHIFDVEEMTGLWVAEGLTQVSSKEVQVHADFSKLLDECFVICTESGSTDKVRYKMQFLLHNFARHLAKKRGYESIKIQNYNNLSNRSIRYISLLVDRGTEKLPRSLVEQKDLRTLILTRKQEMVLGCRRSEIREVPSDYCHYLTALRVLDLHATRINKLPDTFDMLSNLRYLNLSQTDITKLPESFDRLQYLIYLNLAETCIAEVPEWIGKIKSLRYLNISQTRVRKLPDTIGELRSLRTLQLSRCKKLVKLSQDITSLTNLQKLDLEGCHYLTEMPPDVSSLKNLKELNILECSSLERMPNGLSALTEIEILPRYIIATSGNNNSITELEHLNKLKRLGLENIGRMSIDEAQNIQLQQKHGLEHLTLHFNMDDKSNSTSRVVELLDYLEPNCPAPNSLEPNCPAPNSLEPNRPEPNSPEPNCPEPNRPEPNSLEPNSPEPNSRLRILEIISYAGDKFPSWISSSKKASQFSNLAHIRLVNLKCHYLPALQQLPYLTTLEISGMDAIEHVDVEVELNSESNGQSKTFPSLEKLTFTQMKNLESWPADGAKCDHLKELSIIQCPKFRKLSMCLPVEKLTICMSHHEQLLAEGGLAGVVGNLKSLSISLCGKLSSSSNIEGLKALTELEKLEISGCDKLENFPPGLKKLAFLKSLSVIGCCGLRDLSCLLECTSLRSLRISGCPMVTSLCFPSLEKLKISGCDKLVEIAGQNELPPGMENLASLTRLSITGCSRLQDLSYLEKCSCLRSVRISDCSMLTVTSIPVRLRKITTWE